MSSGREVQIKLPWEKKVHVSKQLVFPEPIIFLHITSFYAQCFRCFGITEIIFDYKNDCHIGI